jgi:hypothetical protein
MAWSDRTRPGLNWMAVCVLLVGTSAYGAGESPPRVKFKLTEPEEMSREQYAQRLRNPLFNKKLSGGGEVRFGRNVIGLSEAAREKLAHELSYRSSWQQPQRALYCNWGLLIVAYASIARSGVRREDALARARLSSVARWMTEHGYDESLVLLEVRMDREPFRKDLVDYEFLDDWMPHSECMTKRDQIRSYVVRGSVR